MQYQSDHVLRIIEQMGLALRLAFERYRDGDDGDSLLMLTGRAIEMVVDMKPELFLTLSPISMVTFVEISGFDDRLVVKLAEALNLEAEILESEGNIIESGVRREQAAALNNTLDPARAN